MLIIKKSVNMMIKKKYGRIINTSSIVVKFGGEKNTFSYSLSKHINEFIPGFYKAISSKNIFYNVLRIGLIDTKVHKKIKSKNMLQRIKMIPVKKIAKPLDIANYIKFLCMENNNFITNEIVNINGGE
jgi:3-oxoacyl-[acyl-carrier protein] reductase